MAKKKAKKKTVKRAASTRALNDSIKDAIKYPWNKMQRAFWLLLGIIPIFGSFPIGGYLLEIMQAVVNGKDKELPKFTKYWYQFGQGFYLLIFSIILMVVFSIALRIPIVGWIFILYLCLITPMLVINYSVKRRFGAFFDIGLVTKIVFGHFVEYIVMILKIIVTALFWLLCSIPIITLIWTGPAMRISSTFLVAQFYRKYR